MTGLEAQAAEAGPLPRPWKESRWVPAPDRRGLYFSGKGGVQVRVGLHGQGKEMSSNFWSSILRSSRKRVGVRMCEEPGQEGRVGVDASVPDTSQLGRLSLGDQALALSTQCTHRDPAQLTPPRTQAPSPIRALGC